MLAYSNTEIEQYLRDARLLFEELDQVLDAPTPETNAYRCDIEMMVNEFKNRRDISRLKSKITDRYWKLENQLVTVNFENN